MNIVEYKSPEYYISVTIFGKVPGYVCIYQADTGKVLEIPPEELTITLVGDHYPRRLVRHLQDGIKDQECHKGHLIHRGLYLPKNAKQNSCQKKNIPGLAGFEGVGPQVYCFAGSGNIYKKNDPPIRR